MSNTNHLFERRDLGDGWYAVKRPSEREWTLKKGGEEYGQGSLSECKTWVEVRNEWRQSIEQSQSTP